MYGRLRGGGRGFRPNNAVGMGAVAIRQLPDGPGRVGFYNSGYRKFNRGFGRGQGRYFNSQQPLRKEDMLMEAGRLAAEYLVAKGMLSPNSLPSKFQNGGFRKEVGEFQEFRQQDGEYMQIDSRTSALDRLGSFEGASDKKRYSIDYSAASSKPNLRGIKETGSFSNYDSDRGQENGKSGSISGRSRASSDKEADDDALSVRRDEQLTTKDDEPNNKDVESATKSNGTENSLSVAVADAHQLVNDLSSKTGVSNIGKDSEHLTDIEGNKECDGFGNANVEYGEMKESKNNEVEVTGQYSPIEDSIIQPNQPAANPTQKGSELLQLCNFAKVPTRTRSLRSKGSKGTTIEEGNNSAPTSTYAILAKPLDSDVTYRTVVCMKMEHAPLLDGHTSTGTLVDPELLVDDDVVGLPESTAVLDQNDDLMTANIISMDTSDQSFGKSVLLDHDTSAEGSKCLESLSFPDRPFAYSEEYSQGPLGSRSCNSVDEFVARDRGEKRVLDDCDLGGAFKKIKSWPLSMMGQVDEYPYLSNIRTEESTIADGTSQPNNLMMIGQDSSNRISGSTLGDDDSTGYAEKKQMMDSSFKICDLNLMEVSHIDDNHDGSQMMFFPSMSGLKKEPLSVDGGLIIGENSNMSHNRKYSTVGAHGEEVEVINLDNDFDDETTFNNEDKRGDAVYTGIESFPNQPRGTSDGTYVQDDRFMFPELLGNEIPNCSTVPGDINLHGGMGLHNGQGILPEDDSIYMTLGEIPIGYWEPPNPDFGKPF